MNIVVSGGAGFIGSHLCEKLLDIKHKVFCVDNLLTGSINNIQHLKKDSNFVFIDQDVNDPLQITQKIGAIFHLASPASPNHHSKLSYHALPMETMMVNTQGTKLLLELALRNEASFLFSSTSEIYGDPLVHPQTEDYNGNVSTTGPRSVYDEAKRFGETLCAYFGREKNIPVRIARIFNTYGPRMLKEDMRMVIIFITQALENKPITIFGDGSQTRSLCYVDDTVEGLISFMFNESKKTEAINIGSPEEHTVLEYAKIIKELTHSKSDIVFSEKLPKDDPRKRKPDISKAKKLLGWSPKVPLKEGLNKVIDYFKTII